MPSSSPAKEPQHAQDVSQSQSVCPACGGSGLLRLGEQHYRTCLACLAQGTRPLALSGSEPSSASR